jgi:precorrin-2 C(20)-methyltransferase
VTGTLYGVGVGPGDPSLMTVRAVDLVRGADVVAYHCARHGRSNARAVVAQYLGTQVEEQLTYPVTTERTDDYQGRLDAFYADAAARLAAHLDAGRDVVVIAEGDPFFYGSYMHLHVRLADRFETEVIPGVTAMSGCWSAAGIPLMQGDDVTTVLPGTLREPELARRLAGTDAAVIMKVGRNLAKVRRALKTAGRLGSAIYVERGTMENALALRLVEKADDRAPYFSVVLVPGWAARPAAKAKSEAA